MIIMDLNGDLGSTISDSQFVFIAVMLPWKPYIEYISYHNVKSTRITIQLTSQMSKFRFKIEYFHQFYRVLHDST